jgi:hypothetical protein
MCAIKKKKNTFFYILKFWIGYHNPADNGHYRKTKVRKVHYGQKRFHPVIVV